MLGTKIQKAVNLMWLYAACGLFGFSLTLFFWLGPKWVIACSAFGFAVSVMGMALAHQDPIRYPSSRLSATFAVLHSLCILIAWGLSAYLLTPLSDKALELPRFGFVYDDPGGMFTLKGPVDWKYTPIVSATESGVRIQPSSRADYMGVSELTVMVKKMESPPADVEIFLEKMAESLSKSKRKVDKNKLFHFHTDRIQLLDRSVGVVSTLDVNRLWIPLRQVTLFGLRKGVYFIGISATGLTAHSTLSKVLCIGVFHKLEIKNIPTKRTEPQLQ